jgi:translation initiation factor 1
MRLFAGTPFDRPPQCDRCGKPEEECQCAPEPPPRVPLGKQTARVSVEKRKHGRLMTIVRGLAAADNDLPDLLKQLKNACGAGGTIDEDLIEIQGDQAERVRTTLSKIGYRVK